MARQTDDGSESGYDDISAEDTKLWLWVFVVVGWLVCALQALIVHSVDTRMIRVMEANGANKVERVVELLQRLQESLLEREKARATLVEEDLENDADEATVVGPGEHAHLHMPWSSKRHILTTGGEDSNDDPEDNADHIMVFKEVGQDSNDILSVRQFDTLVFTTQLWMLVCDFYFAFYIVHMRKRVPKAYGHEAMGEGHVGQQIVFHVLILVPIALICFLLMLTTRKIALLFGVLHLNEDAVSDVLQHMELVKSIRRRIQDTLASTKIVHSTPNPAKAKAVLEKAEKGEKAILKLLAERSKADRINGTDMFAMIKAHEAFVEPVIASELTLFLDREVFRKYQLMDPMHQETAQSAKTLQEAAGSSDLDSIFIAEFSSFILRFLCYRIDQTLAMSPQPGLVHKFTSAVVALDSVDEKSFHICTQLTRAKELFKLTDADHSGEISRSELYAALRRFKVPISKAEYLMVFRVIDPDQSHRLVMEEWVDFMMATDAGVDQKHTDNTAAGAAAAIAAAPELSKAAKKRASSPTPGGGNTSTVWPEDTERGEQRQPAVSKAAAEP